ncbi:putative MFS-type transporter [Blattamonas nauphoetae]|uniref:MFS-type transporter n=1 Tax=Blattamonas nauphoetae TaxID=2049346 RepID=A0ABQ9WLH7_9EUKA|nr:putative MFS-type transporter [Blattamonas nauphoetae]
MSIEVLLLTSLPSSVSEYYGSDVMSMLRQNQVLSFAAIAFIPFMFWMFFVEAFSHNFRVMTLHSTFGLVACCVFRLIPTWIPPLKKYCFPFLMLGQMANNYGAAFSFAIPSKLGALWFPAKERPFATTIATQVSPVGIALSYLIMPALVKNGSQLPFALHLCLGLQVLCSLVIVICFPAAPPTPPSNSESFKLDRPDNQTVTPPPIDTIDAPPSNEKVSFSQRMRLAWSSFVEDMSVMKNLQFWLLAGLGGVQSGTVQSWAANIVFFFTSLGQTESFGGYAAFGHFAISVAGAMVTTWLSQTKLLRKKDKGLMFVEFGLGLVMIVLLMFMLPIFSSPQPLLHAHPALLCVLVVLFGFIAGAPLPLFYDLSAELTFPVSESISGGFVSGFYFVAYFAVPLLFSATGIGWMSFITFLFLVGVVLVLIFVRIDYRRSRVEEGGSLEDDEKQEKGAISIEMQINNQNEEMTKAAPVGSEYETHHAPSPNPSPISERFGLEQEEIERIEI